MIRPLTVNNHAKLGVLVKKWSKDETSRPKSLDEFKTALADAGIDFDLDPGITSLSFRTHLPNELVIRLPPADMITEHEQRLQSQGYNLPDFYGAVTAEGAQPGASFEVKLDFDNARTGDYTIANCA
ncbi:MAG: hypothetical protein AB7F22_09385 [Reyranella sp.]|uniref:hypothetical protein n=1 Tax=Reyranella sp. TaxID=1929291 RepID=UPI003D1409F0